MVMNVFRAAMVQLLGVSIALEILVNLQQASEYGVRVCLDGKHFVCEL